MQRETKARVGIAAITTDDECGSVRRWACRGTLLPGFGSQLIIWIPVVVVASIILAAPVAWLIAPRLRARYWRERHHVYIR